VEGLRDGVFVGGFDRGGVEGGGPARGGGEGEVEALGGENGVGVGEFGLWEGGCC
jgi:hypothetical protein